MTAKMTTMIGLLTAALLMGPTLPTATADEAVDKALDVLKTYDWGADRNQLKPIDDAVAASHGDADAQKALAGRLAAVLGTDATQAAKDYVCRKLSLIGAADSVPALASLLPDEKLSHMARYALERMPCDEALAAMRAALDTTKGRTKVGVINSLGVRGDTASTAAMVSLLADGDAEIAGAAAAALGGIGTADAAKALGAYQADAPEGLKPVAVDAYLACAEKLLAAGDKTQAMLIYKALAKPDQPKHVRVAAMRGLLAATGKK